MPGCSYDSESAISAFGKSMLKNKDDEQSSAISNCLAANHGSRRRTRQKRHIRRMRAPGVPKRHSSTQRLLERESPCGMKLRCPRHCGYVPKDMNSCSSTCNAEREALPVNMMPIHHPDLHLLPNAQRPLDQEFSDLNIQRYCLRENF
jgi:hypothetical protein